MKIHESSVYPPIVATWHVVEARVIKQVVSCFIQIEGCKRQFIQVFKKQQKKQEFTWENYWVFLFLSWQRGVQQLPREMSERRGKSDRIKQSQMKTVLSVGFASERTVLIFLFLVHIYCRQYLECMSRSTGTSQNQFCQVVCRCIRQQILDKTYSNILIHFNQLRQQNIHPPPRSESSSNLDIQSSSASIASPF